MGAGVLSVWLFRMSLHGDSTVETAPSAMPSLFSKWHCNVPPGIVTQLFAVAGGSRASLPPRLSWWLEVIGETGVAGWLRYSRNCELGLVAPKYQGRENPWAPVSWGSGWDSEPVTWLYFLGELQPCGWI